MHLLSPQSHPDKPKKSLGQHFLRSAWVRDTMIRAAALSKSDTVLEVGPGMGALTYALDAAAGRVIAVEKDERIANILAADLKNRGITNVKIIKGDILKFLLSPNDKRQLTSDKIVACIPYYLTSRLIRSLLTSPAPPAIIVLTVQKEVAERIAAGPPRMNLLGLAVQIYANPRIIKNVPADCFRPRPKVDSAIIRIVPRETPLFARHDIRPSTFFAIAKKAFGQKRKTLGRSLQEYAPALPAWAQKKRPQELTVAEWIKLAVQIHSAKPINTPVPHAN